MIGLVAAEGGPVNGITERVERGAALLDEKRPGWWREINLPALDIESRCNCILGQIGHIVYSVNANSAFNYADGMHVVGLQGAEGREYGFDGDVDIDGCMTVAEEDRLIDAEYAALTEAWRDLIEHRRDAASVTT